MLTVLRDADIEIQIWNVNKYWATKKTNLRKSGPLNMATNVHLLRSLSLSTISIKAESLKLESMIKKKKSPDNSNTDKEFQSIAIDEIKQTI